MTADWGSNNGCLFSHCSGGCKSKVSRAMVQTKALGKDPFLLLPSFRWLAAVFGVLLLVTCITLASASVCPCLLPVSKFPSSSKDTSHWTRAHPNPV